MNKLSVLRAESVSKSEMLSPYTNTVPSSHPFSLSCDEKSHPRQPQRSSVRTLTAATTTARYTNENTLPKNAHKNVNMTNDTTRTVKSQISAVDKHISILPTRNPNIVFETPCNTSLAMSSTTTTTTATTTSTKAISNNFTTTNACNTNIKLKDTVVLEARSASSTPIITPLPLHNNSTMSNCVTEINDNDNNNNNNGNIKKDVSRSSRVNTSRLPTLAKTHDCYNLQNRNINQVITSTPRKNLLDRNDATTSTSSVANNNNTVTTTIIDKKNKNNYYSENKCSLTPRYLEQPHKSANYEMWKKKELKNNNNNNNNSKSNNINTTTNTTVIKKLMNSSNNNKCTESIKSNVIRYRTDLNKQVIHFMFHQLPCIKVVRDENDDESDSVSVSMTNNNHEINSSNVKINNDNNNNSNWHIYWMSVGHVHNIFAGTEYRLREEQIINHFPNHTELTRKDLMYKNIKAYLRTQSNAVDNKERLFIVNAMSWRVSALLSQCDVQERDLIVTLLHNKWRMHKECANNYNNNKECEYLSNATNCNNNNPNECTCRSNSCCCYESCCDIHNVTNEEYTIFSFAESVPMTYNIPNDINMFIEEFKRQPKSIWIVKPTSRCQGQGIFLISRIQQLMKWMRIKEKVSSKNSNIPSTTASTNVAAISVYSSIDSVNEYANVHNNHKSTNETNLIKEEKECMKRETANDDNRKRSKHSRRGTQYNNSNKTANNSFASRNSNRSFGTLMQDTEKSNDTSKYNNNKHSKLCNNDAEEKGKWNDEMSIINNKNQDNKGNNKMSNSNNNSNNKKAEYSAYTGTFIVSKYIHKPLLIGNKKFDLRLYVLVTSFSPLVAYLHEDGFARFCATPYCPYSLRDCDLGSHLTNVALQKNKEDYNAEHGGKLTWQNVLLYIQTYHGEYVAQGLMYNVQFLIYHSLRAMEKVMHNDKHCFELYGYDILLDDKVQPHLIEVNASPSLSSTTDADRWLKQKVLSDALKIVLPPNYPANDSMPYAEYRLRTDLTTQLLTGFKLLRS